MVAFQEACPSYKHGGLLQKQGQNGGKATELEKPRGQMLEEFFSELKDLVNGLLRRLMLEKRRLYLEEHPTKGNWYYASKLLTLFGSIEDLRVPRMREKGLPLQTPPYRRRSSPDLVEAVLLLYAPGGEHSGHFSVYRGRLSGILYSPQSIFPPSPRWRKKKVKARREHPLKNEQYRQRLPGLHLSPGASGQAAKEPVHVVLK